jgi:hypothetical protein
VVIPPESLRDEDAAGWIPPESLRDEDETKDPDWESLLSAGRAEVQSALRSRASHNFAPNFAQ